MALPDDGTRTLLEMAFPNLSGSAFEITSPMNTRYNCVAFAAGDLNDWWWPVEPEGQWPEGVARERTVTAFQQMFATLGYGPSESGDLASGIEKVAIYAREGSPTHAARQLNDGRWTSKLGDNVDITHTIGGLEGDVYGKVALILQRPRPAEAG